jgi:hypothetical protein
VGGDYHLVIGGVDKNGKDYGEYREKVTTHVHSYVGGNSYHWTGGDYSRKVGGNTVDHYCGSHHSTVTTEKCTHAPKIIFEAGEAICLKGPGGFILIDGTGVTIVGNLVLINSGGAAIDCGSGGKTGTPLPPKKCHPCPPGYPSTPPTYGGGGNGYEQPPVKQGGGGYGGTTPPEKGGGWGTPPPAEKGGSYSPPPSEKGGGGGYSPPPSEKGGKSNGSAGGNGGGEPNSPPPGNGW